MSSELIMLRSDQKEKILRDIWILHNTRWFLKSVLEVGFDVTTKIHLAVVKSFGRTEMKRLLSETGFRNIKRMEDLKAIMEIAADLYFPEEHKYEFKILDKDTIVGHVVECYIHKYINKAGTTKIHQCAASTRFNSWVKACGLEGEVIEVKNNNCNGTCQIRFNIKW